MASKWGMLVATSGMLFGCASWQPVGNLSSLPPGDLGDVRLMTADSVHIALKDAVLIDASVVGSFWEGQSVKVPVGRIASLEHRETDGFTIFFMANVVSFVLLNEAVKGVKSSRWP